MRSISKTITLSAILGVAAILAIGQVVLDSVVSNWLLRQFDVAMESKTRALVTLTKFDGVEVELDFADEFMPEFEAPADPEYFELFVGDGVLLERSNSFDGYADSRFEDQVSEVMITDLILPDGRRGRRLSIKFIPQITDKLLRDEIPLAQRPRAILRVSRERESLDKVKSQFHWLIIAISLVTLLAVMLSVTLAIKTGLRPLHKMKDDIGEISPQSIDRRIANDDQPAELEPIATQFNLVLAEIEKAFLREREFSSDVAHELRTPVSEIRSLAEVGLRWPDEKDIRSYFADIHESSRQLDRMIGNLLLLSRSEEGDIAVDFRPLDLWDLIDRILAGFETEIRQKNISLETPAREPVQILADPQWMELILSNLISNAISHSPSSASLSIRLLLQGKYCCLEIDNPMQEMLREADLERVFERFWRKDAARATGRHAGIGLSLVRSYAGLMDMAVTAEITAKQRFRIRLSNIKLA